MTKVEILLTKTMGGNKKYIVRGAKVEDANKELDVKRRGKEEEGGEKGSARVHIF